VAEKIGREDVRRQLGGVIIKTAIRKRMKYDEYCYN
jgi:hypothetical protein